MAVAAGHDVATAPASAVERHGQLVVADVALGRIDDRIRALEVVGNQLVATQIKGLRSRIQTDWLASDRQPRSNRDFRLVNLAGVDQVGNRVRLSAPLCQVDVQFIA